MFVFDREASLQGKVTLHESMSYTAMYKLDITSCSLALPQAKAALHVPKRLKQRPRRW